MAEISEILGYISDKYKAEAEAIEKTAMAERELAMQDARAEAEAQAERIIAKANEKAAVILTEAQSSSGQIISNAVLAAKNGTALEGFAVAGADGVYMPAKAEIVSKDTVKVWNISITNPVAVTYAYSQMNNISNLVSVDENGEVLFAVVPFCSIKIDGEQIYRHRN